MVSHKYKCIFIHLPKTGGEAITSLFDDYDKSIPKHANAVQIKEKIGDELWDQYYKFTIIRNPWDQAVSMYAHLRKPLYQKQNIIKKYGKSIINPTNACRTACKKNFNKYCEIVLANNQLQEEQSRLEWPVNHFAPFSDWISNTSGNIIIDYIGRFENLNEEIIKIQRKIGLPLEHLPVKNKSKHKHYSRYYSSRSIDIVAQHYQKDINNFNYEFDDQRKFIDRLKAKL